MSLHSIRVVQRMPVSAGEAWAFYSNPANLRAITPPDMGFRIVSDTSNSIYAGQIIEYRLRPLFGIPVYWRTEIRQAEPPFYFTDVQRKGPYQLWHHQHHFKAIEGGIEMTDIVHYKISFGWLGNLINRWFVRKRLLQIFEYRIKKITEIFGSCEDHVAKVTML